MNTKKQTRSSVAVTVHLPARLLPILTKVAEFTEGNLEDHVIENLIGDMGAYMNSCEPEEVLRDFGLRRARDYTDSVRRLAGYPVPRVRKAPAPDPAPSSEPGGRILAFPGGGEVSA